MSSNLIEVATSPYQWNGVALSPKGRIFVSFPRWIEQDTISVGEILPGGKIEAFPGGTWNTWHPEHSPCQPEQRFVGVNAVFTTGEDETLWVVDSGSVRFGEGITIPNGPKLVRFDIDSGRVLRNYPLGPSGSPPGSYPNDVRIGVGHAFLTDSGDAGLHGNGALIVVDLTSGEVRRLLAGHPSVQSDPNVQITVEGRKMQVNGGPVKFAVNELELTPDGQFLLFQPIGGPNWWRIPVGDLVKPEPAHGRLKSLVARDADTMPIGGSTMDQVGNIYLMDVQRQAIWRQRRPGGTRELVLQDPRLAWPDACDIGPDGCLYIPASQLHRLPIFHHGTNRRKQPFCLFKLCLEEP